MTTPEERDLLKKVFGFTLEERADRIFETNGWMKYLDSPENPEWIEFARRSILSSLQEAVAAEREACARMAEQEYNDVLAGRIRARGKEGS